MPQPKLELADVFRLHGPEYRRQHDLPLAHLRVMRAIESCRTAVLGGHRERCQQCALERNTFNSCRNRHCPKCQRLDTLEWLSQRQQELLPIPYFHVVFTVPEQIAAIARQNDKVLFQILFRASAKTLLTIAADPKHLGARIGFFSILHTWGQNLSFHPHVHCVVTGGGLSPDGQQWISCRPDFFLSVRVLSRLFRRLFLEELLSAYQSGQLQFHGPLENLRDPQDWAAFLAPVRESEWVVYAKPPFGGPEQVIDYLGRYTHRVALSNERLLSLDDQQVSFQYKDYRSAEPQRSRSLSLPADQFIRRFLQHVLPSGFQRIRYYGLLANRSRVANLTQCRALFYGARPDLLPAADSLRAVRDSILQSVVHCPRCRCGVMVRVAVIPPVRWPAGLPPDTS